MSTHVGVDAREAFVHEALLYAGEDELVARSAEFVREGQEAGEPTLVVVPRRKLERLRETLGDTAGVQFADMDDVGRNPARIIPAWEDFVSRHAAPGVRLRGIGEPISADRDPEQLVECQRHESLLNLAFPGSGGFWLLCPYDTASLPQDVLDEAARSHTHLAHDGRHDHSQTYAGVGPLGRFLGAPLAAPPAEAAELRVGADELALVPRFVAEQAASAGLGFNRRVDLVVAADGIVREGLEHGGGSALLRVWTEPRRLLCEIRDASRIADPLADRQLPGEEPGARRGLVIANQLCDLVQVRSGATGTVVRLRMALPGA